MSREFGVQLSTRTRGLRVGFGDYDVEVLGNGEWLVAAYPKAHLSPPNAEELAPPLRSFTLPLAWTPEEPSAEPAAIGPGAAELVARHLGQYGEPLLIDDRSDRDPRHPESASGVVLQPDGTLVWAHVWRDPQARPQVVAGTLDPTGVQRLRAALQRDQARRS